jgi:GTP 3',8-cyclase
MRQSDVTRVKAQQDSVGPESLPERANIAPLVDRFGRVHTALRISVTDRCNIRCQYCMPDTVMRFLPQNHLLSFEAIERFVRIVAAAGVNKLRITGGEPLLRPKLEELIERIAHVPGVDDLALTTNGMLLRNQVANLVNSGLKRINISLDTLNEFTFETIARRKGLQSVLDGIEATRSFPQLRVRLNALILKHINQSDIIPLVHFALGLGMPIRFIEFMPLDAERKWDGSQMLNGAEIRKLIEHEFGPLRPKAVTDPAQPAQDFETVDGKATIGFINSVSSPFCSQCNRIRLTADGKIQNCLFGREDWSVAELLRDPQCSDAEILTRVRDAVANKHAAHGISQPGFEPPQRAMYQIGG